MSDDWLYGRSSGERPKDDPAGGDPDATRPVPRPDATRPVPRQQAPRQPRPEETQVLPVQPRSQGASASQATGTRPVPPPAAPPPVGTGGGFGGFGGFMENLRDRFSGIGRPRFKLRYLWFLVLLWLVYLIAVPFFAWQKVDHVDALPAQGPADQPGTNYLIVGSDSRKGLSPQERKLLHTGNDVGQRTDTIMLLHVGKGPDLLMSIPRDSSVPIPGHGTTKINAAFAYGGPKLLVRTIQQNTGIHIDHYVEIGFGGFVNVVDAVGGITICPSHNMNDKLANLHIKKGCQHVNGRVALAYARSRHADPRLGDIARGGQQRQVVSAVGHRALSPWTFLNPFRYWNLNMSAADSLKVDKDMGVFSMARAAWGMTHAQLNCVVPISDLYVHWDPTRSKQMFHDIINDDTSAIGKNLCTQSGLPRS
jgi:LCP family protein required for cell wall assembly